MQIKYVGDDGQVLRCKADGRITQNAFEPGNDSFADTFGPDVYGRKVLLDLAESDYIDSSGVGWLLGSSKKFKQAGGALVLYSVPPTVQQLLQLLRLGSVLKVAADSAAARQLALGEAA